MLGVYILLLAKWTSCLPKYRTMTYYSIWCPLPTSNETASERDGWLRLVLQSKILRWDLLLFCCYHANMIDDFTWFLCCVFTALYPDSESRVSGAWLNQVSSGERTSLCVLHFVVLLGTFVNVCNYLWFVYKIINIFGIFSSTVYF